jgi:hypothetical protein
MIHNTRPGNAIKTFLLVASLAFVAPPARAGGPVVWELNSREELLKGEARGVSVTDTGALMLAPRFAQLFDTEQAYVWSTAADAAGNVYLGTGHDGRVFRVAADGRGALVYDAAELDVTALAVGRDGALYAGTSPDGKVYRIPAGAAAGAQAAVYFDPPDKYIWSLAVMPDGALAVGTGDAGKIYRVRAANARAEESLLVDINETHVMSLAVDRQGDLVAGTDPGGLVIRVNAQGKAFALFDAPLREIHSLASAPDGSLYVLALGEAASSARPQAAVSASSASTAAGSVSSVTMTVTEDVGGGAQAQQFGGAQQQQQPARSRNELANARSAVFRVLPDGGSDVLWSSQQVTAFSVAPAPQGGVLIGTSDKGRIYQVTDDGRDTLLVQSSEDQISSLVVRGRDVLAASSNQGKLFRLTAEPAGEGTYESPVRDARFSAAWGRIWWRGRGAVELQTRSGNTERPDQTWSEWSEPYRAAAGAAVTSPRARFIQWRAVLRSQAGGVAAAEAARVEGVSVAYLPRNVAPEVVQVTTLPVGVALLPAVQVQTDPNLEASGLDPSLIAPVPQVPARRAFQRGAIAIQWQAEDRNGDSLEYAVYYRALGETDFHLLRENLRDNFFTVDGAALGDGRYVFRVVATDAPDNSVGAALAGERTSEPVQIDNTPPVVRAVGKPALLAGLNTSLAFTAEDANGMIRRADVSMDGGPWRAVFPEDGIADSPAETFRLSLPLSGAGEHIVALRVFDAGGNTGNARVVVRK